MAERSFEAIGTAWTIIFPELPVQEIDRILALIRERIDRFDHDYSRFRDDSLVARMAREPGTYVLPEDAEPMLDLYRDLYRRTDGAFTLLIGQTLSDAGYDAQYSFTTSSPAPAPSWDETLTYAYPELTLHTPALLDFGAAGKGYLVDLVADLLRGEGIEAFVIDAGGDIRAEGMSIEVGLEHPEDATQAIGVATLTSRSICGSSGSRRAWGEYHHILDPRTATSPRQVLATWVVADTTMLADALATCLYFAEPDLFRSAYPFEYLVLYPDYSTGVSSGFPAELFNTL